MKAAGRLFLRSMVMAVVIVAAAALFFAVQSQLTSRALSDQLVYASFFLVTIGALLGMFKLGYKRHAPEPGEPPEGRLEHSLKEFLRVDILGWSLCLAGALCFGAAVLVDMLFK